jgi:phosphoribosyl-dephospho-CoA transferase
LLFALVFTWKNPWMYFVGKMQNNWKWMVHIVTTGLKRIKEGKKELWENRHRWWGLVVSWPTLDESATTADLSSLLQVCRWIYSVAQFHQLQNIWDVDLLAWRGHFLTKYGVGQERVCIACYCSKQVQMVCTAEAASVSRRALRPTQPPIRLVPGSFPGGRVRLGYDADHSPPSSGEIRNE